MTGAIKIVLTERFKGTVYGGNWKGWIIRNSATKLWFAESNDNRVIKRDLASRGEALSALMDHYNDGSTSFEWNEEYLNDKWM